MATVRKMWACKNTNCKNPETGKHRGYKKVQAAGEVKAVCKWCAVPMVLNDNYTTRMQVNGEVRSKLLTGDKEFAGDYIAECRTAARVGNLLPGEEQIITWAEAKKRFEAWLDDPGAQDKILSAKTITFYKSMLIPLEKEFTVKKLGKVDFTKMTLQDIQKKHVDAFKSFRMKTCAASTVNGSLATLKRLYSVICSDERAKETPRLHEAMTDIFKVKLLELDNEQDNILETETEMQALLSFCKAPHLHHFVYGILNTGLRHVDMLKLKIPEISFPKNEIVTTVKGGKQVEIPLTGAYRAYLEEWLKPGNVHRINGYLIPSKVRPAGGGERPYRVDSDIGFETACENTAAFYDQLASEAGNKHDRQAAKAIAEKFRLLTPHHLRHTFATHFLYKTSKQFGATVAVHALSKILGHSSTYITERYSHALKEVQQAAMADFGAQMFTVADSR